MQKTFLITGGAGFIGSHLADMLIKDNKVICLDDFNDFYSPDIKRNNVKKHLNNSNYKLYEYDIVDYENIKKIFEENKIDCIIHLAARAGIRPSLTDPILYTKTNIVGTINLLDLAKDYKINKFIMGSSSSVYGERTDDPFNEEMIINKPISPYAATKASNEQMCYTYSRLYGINIVCLRFFTVYGPRQRPDSAIHKFSRQIVEGKTLQVFGHGKTIRDYTYIDDINQGILAAIDYDKSEFEIFNIGESRPIKLSSIIILLEENLGKKAILEKRLLQPGDVPITYADITKAKELLGYQPSTTIKRGVKKFIAWFKEFYNYCPSNLICR